MAIDLTKRSDLITLATAGQLLGVSVNTLHRWRMRGVRGVKLETAFLGSRVFTTRAAINSFLARLNGTDSPADAIPASALAAGQQLAAAGC